MSYRLFGTIYVDTEAQGRAWLGFLASLSTPATFTLKEVVEDGATTTERRIAGTINGKVTDD